MADGNEKKAAQKAAKPKRKSRKKAGRPLSKDEISVEQIEQTLIDCGGILPAVAKALKITRQTLYKRLDTAPHLKAVIKKCRRDNCAIAEAHLVKAIRAGDKALGIKYLEQFDPDYARTTKVKVGIDTETLQAIVASFGGDVEKLRAFRAAVVGPGSA